MIFPAVSPHHPGARARRLGMPPALSGLGQRQLAARAAGDGLTRKQIGDVMGDQCGYLFYIINIYIYIKMTLHDIII